MRGRSSGRRRSPGGCDDRGAGCRCGEGEVGAAEEMFGVGGRMRRAYASVPAEQGPMLNFDDRDLLRKARAAGFAALELDYRAEVEVPEPLPTSDWEVLKKTAPNPLAAHSRRR